MVGVLALQQGLFAPRALPRFTATADPSATLSPSTDFPVSPVIRFPAPQISPRDEEGFSSCLTCPCHRAVANSPPERLVASISLRRSMLPSPPNRGFGLWISDFRGHLCVHFRYSPMTCSPSHGWLCRSTPCASFPPRMRSQLQGSDFSPGGSTSHWIHQPSPGHTVRLLSPSLRSSINHSLLGSRGRHCYAIKWFFRRFHSGKSVTQDLRYTYH
jgi:hypothetical protein